MESKLKNDREALGALISYRILKNKKNGSKRIDEQKFIWKTFQKLSTFLGDDFMNFPDFEHFYWKLEKGECELDYDGRPEYNRNLFDLPENIIRLITKDCENSEKWVLRESSSSFHKIIDSYFQGCEKLKIQIYDKRCATVKFEGDKFESRLYFNYEKRSEKSGEMEVHRYLFQRKLDNGGRTVEEAMIRDIRQMLENPRNRLVELSIKSTLPPDNSFFKNLKRLLESQEDVQNLTIYSSSPSHFHSILSGLKPKTLENIELKSAVMNLDLSGIVEMDQLKQAKRVKIWCQNATYPLNGLMHLEEYWGCRNCLEPEEVLAIKNEMTRTENMERFLIFTANRVSIQEINDALGPLNPEFNDTEERRHFRIENSEEFMKLEIIDYFIKFSRTSEIFAQRNDSMDLLKLQQEMMDPDNFIEDLW